MNETYKTGRYGRVFFENEVATKKFSSFAVFCRELFWLSVVKNKSNFCQVLDYNAANKEIQMKKYQYDMYTLSQILPIDKKIKIIDSIIDQIIAAVTFLGQRGISHNDIKMSNIFCNYDFDTDCIECFLGDFSCTSIKPYNIEISAEYSLYFNHDMEKSTFKQRDLWSVGATIVSFLTGLYLWEEIVYDGYRTSFSWDFRKRFPHINISEKCFLFLTSCLTKNPSNRFTIQETNKYIELFDRPVDNKVIIKLCMKYAYLNGRCDTKSLNVITKITQISCYGYNISSCEKNACTSFITDNHMINFVNSVLT